MQVKQRLSILFFLKRKKKGNDQNASIYVRITVDGLKEELSLSIMVDVNQWDEVNTRFLKIRENQKYGPILKTLWLTWDPLPMK